MENVQVHRYSDDMPGWAGYVEPDSRRWILFIGRDGHVLLFDPLTDRVVATL
jgi:hypothetical protein